MRIRKEFKFEGAHIVRNCSSDRCKKSIHGHSYIVEVMLESNNLDNGGMVYDFGLLKTTVADFIDSFDHAYSMWSEETLEFKDFIYKNSDRVVELPVSPSAENYALTIAYVVSKILDNTCMMNNEDFIKLSSVRVHETRTGWAEADLADVQRLWNHSLDDIRFTEAITSEWRDPSMWDQLRASIPFTNPQTTKTHG